MTRVFVVVALICSCLACTWGQTKPNATPTQFPIGPNSGSPTATTGQSAGSAGQSNTNPTGQPPATTAAVAAPKVETPAAPVPQSVVLTGNFSDVISDSHTSECLPLKACAELLGGDQRTQIGTVTSVEFPPASQSPDRISQNSVVSQITFGRPKPSNVN